MPTLRCWSGLLTDVSGVQGFSLLHSGCSALAFSQDGRYLAAARRPMTTFHIFGLGANQGLVATASTGKDKVLDLAFSKDSTIVYGASTHSVSARYMDALLKVKRASLLVRKTSHFLLRVHSNGDEEKCVVGTQSGPSTR